MRTEGILLIRSNCFEMWWPGTELSPAYANGMCKLLIMQVPQAAQVPNFMYTCTPDVHGKYFFARRKCEFSPLCRNRSL